MLVDAEHKAAAHAAAAAVLYCNKEMLIQAVASASMLMTSVLTGLLYLGWQCSPSSQVYRV